MEGVNSNLSALIPFGYAQKEGERETLSPGTSWIWVPAFAGMTKSEIVFRPECPKSFKTTNPTLSPFSSNLCKRLVWPGFLQPLPVGNGFSAKTTMAYTG